MREGNGSLPSNFKPLMRSKMNLSEKTERRKRLKNWLPNKLYEELVVIESIRSRIPENVYLFLTTSRLVWEDDACERNYINLWEDYEEFAWEGYRTQCENFLGGDVYAPELENLRWEIGNVSPVVIRNSLNIFKEFPHV